MRSERKERLCQAARGGSAQRRTQHAVSGPRARARPATAGGGARACERGSARLGGNTICAGPDALRARPSWPAPARTRPVSRLCTGAPSGCARYGATVLAREGAAGAMRRGEGRGRAAAHLARGSRARRPGCRRAAAAAARRRRPRAPASAAAPAPAAAARPPPPPARPPARRARRRVRRPPGARAAAARPAAAPRRPRAPPPPACRRRGRPARAPAPPPRAAHAPRPALEATPCVRAAFNGGITSACGAALLRCILWSAVYICSQTSHSVPPLPYDSSSPQLCQAPCATATAAAPKSPQRARTPAI